MTDLCPCGSEISFARCCEPYLKNEAKPTTAEKLMRSRYTAYTRGDINYIKRTLAPEFSRDFDRAASQKWADEVEWLGLKILSTDKGQESDAKGMVEFVAMYRQNGQTLEHHEVSQFRNDAKSGWLFVDGDAQTYKEGEEHRALQKKQETVVREGAKVGRNDPCPCGSGKKYKKCCGT